MAQVDEYHPTLESNKFIPTCLSIKFCFFAKKKNPPKQSHYPQRLKQDLPTFYFFHIN